MENIGICLPQPGLPRGGAGDHPAPRHAADLRRGEDRHHRRLGRCHRRARRAARPRRAGQEHRRRPAASARSAARPSAWTRSPPGRVLHLGTYNGNPLCMAAAKAVLAEVCTPEATAEAIDRNARLLDGVRRRHRPPPACRRTPCSSAPRAASRGRRRRCATTATTRPPTSTWPSPSGSTGSTAACSCRPASTSSGSISVLHTDDEAMRYADVFAEFVAELTA